MPMEESKMSEMASEREEFFSLSPKTVKSTAISIKTFYKSICKSIKVSCSGEVLRKRVVFEYKEELCPGMVIFVKPNGCVVRAMV